MQNCGRLANERWIVGNTSANHGAFVALDGETAAGPVLAAANVGRHVRVTGIHFSTSVATTFAVRATDGTNTDPIYPPSGQFCNVAAGGVIDTEIVEYDLLPGQWIEWESPSGGVNLREVGVRVNPLQYGDAV